MNGIRFAHPELVHLTWAALALVLVLGWLDLRGREALERFLSRTMRLRLTERATTARRVARLLLVLATLLLGVVALMRSQTRGATESTRAQRISADVMVVLDVSKSMLAEDAAPNRLDRAKAEIAELVERLGDHRLGLVAFAGRATVACPLTTDHGFFRMVLRGIDTTTVSRGGTRIGAAIRKAIEAFSGGTGPRLVLLITDGEDHDSYAREAASEAAAEGIRIVTIGFGSEGGSQILITDPETGGQSVLTDRDGQVVISRLDGELLRDIALETEGVYVPAGTAALDLESIVDSHVTPIVRETEAVQRTVTIEHHRWFVLGSLVALVASTWLGATTGRRKVAA